MKLDPYRKQRGIQFHACFYVRTVAEHTMRVDCQPDLLEIEEERVLLIQFILNAALQN